MRRCGGDAAVGTEPSATLNTATGAVCELVMPAAQLWTSEASRKERRQALGVRLSGRRPIAAPRGRSTPGAKNWYGARVVRGLGARRLLPPAYGDAVAAS